MSAPVTQAHRELLHQLLMNVEHGYLKEAAQLIADSEALATVELKKQADHWCDMHTVCAKEANQLRAELATCNDASEALVESLRAEVERLKRDYDYDHKCLHEVRERCELWKQRAERAEAEMERLKPYVSKAVLTHEGTMLCSPLVAVKFNEQTARAERAEAELANIRALANRRNKRDHSQDTTHQLVAALDQALDIAQAELATERAKYNQLLSALVYADQILDDIDTCSDAHKPMYSSYSQNVFKLCIKGRDARRAFIDVAIKGGA